MISLDFPEFMKRTNAKSLSSCNISSETTDWMSAKWLCLILVVAIGARDSNFSSIFVFVSPVNFGLH